MTRRSERFRYQLSSIPAAIAISLQEPYQPAHEAATSSLELVRLARAVGIEVVRTVQQKCADGALSALLSDGRLRELARLTGGPGPRASGPHSPPPAREPAEEEAADLVLVDGMLSPAQQRTLELALGVEVLDRTALILRIFERRARTREARLQVALARLLHQTPRIRDDHALGDREGGGGRGGRGHSNVELQKQRNREKMAALRQELAALPARDQLRRAAREALPQVALVGYTNAGKSSWLRALTGSQVFIDDAPFATVDTTVRALAPETVPRILVSDTVGFLTRLPHELVASFRSTLEEARAADLLLLVVDASDPDFREQLYVTRQTLMQIGAGDLPQRVILNKSDRLPRAQREALAAELPEALLLSAHAPEDVSRLRTQLVAEFERTLIDAVLVVSYAQGALRNELHRRGQVLEERHTPAGSRLRVRALPELVARWRGLLAERAPSPRLGRR